MEEESDYKYDPGSNTFSLVVGPYLVKEQDDGKGVYIFSVLLAPLLRGGSQGGLGCNQPKRRHFFAFL